VVGVLEHVAEETNVLRPGLADHEKRVCKILAGAASQLT
jgi:hypothetical protein